MPIFQFTATDQTGAPSEGTFEAVNEEQAYVHIRARTCAGRDREIER